MIYGIGIDILYIKRIENIFNKYKTKFSDKILTKREYVIFNKFLLEKDKNKKNINLFLSSKFSSKESISKSLKTGISYPILWKNIEILNNKDGKPEVNFLFEAKNFINKNYINKIHLTISHEIDYVVSYCISEKK